MHFCAIHSPKSVKFHPRAQDAHATKELGGACTRGSLGSARPAHTIAAPLAAYSRLSAETSPGRLRAAVVLFIRRRNSLNHARSCCVYTSDRHARRIRKINANSDVQQRTCLASAVLARASGLNTRRTEGISAVVQSAHTIAFTRK